MSFASGAYLLFLPVTAGLYRLCPGKYRWLLLLAASYGFYMGWSVPLTLLLLTVTGLSWGACLLMERKKSRALLGASLALIFLPLFLCKYAGFFAAASGSLFGWPGGGLQSALSRLALPVGISFYTFQAASCVIDVYRGEQEPEKNFFRFALFVSFFPQLVAGPIERGKDLLPQLRAARPAGREDFRAGLRWLLSGFFRKICVADFLAAPVDRIFSLPRPDGFSVLLGAVLFGYQIYNDFAGYSEIALGSARLLGIRLTRNFRAPYLASGIRDFWRRWHITLNRWFRLYVYQPLGGRRRRLPVAAVFLLSGLWHGADLTFLCWGGLHAALYAVEGWAEKKKWKPPEALSTAAVFLLVSLSWIFFRAEGMLRAGQLYAAVFSPWSLGRGWLESGLSLSAVLHLLLLLAVSGGMGRWTEKEEGAFSHRDAAAAVLFALLIGLCWLMNLRDGGANAFIYFQF